MTSKKEQNHSQKQKLPIIKCECGHEILLLLDLQVLSQEIEEHALEHKKKFALTQEETKAIENALIAKAFELFSELKN
jgi:hypothetical protein